MAERLEKDGALGDGWWYEEAARFSAACSIVRRSRGVRADDFVPRCVVRVERFPLYFLAVLVEDAVHLDVEALQGGLRDAGRGVVHLVGRLVDVGVGPVMATFNVCLDIDAAAAKLAGTLGAKREIVWLPIAELPQPDRPPGGGQAENYGFHLAGKPVRHTLHASAAWFATKQNRTGSPVAVGSWDAVEG
ncbi:hypothetical protein [Streptomyces sp. CAI-85]|uniref:hypothetical protein n=1 Tax=Streptomyces sp. CAI-85 TaxID=1472662 RepID=UPI0015879E8C|nr:hypothetical protein [Streptomyces sp. CAI-85]